MQANFKQTTSKAPQDLEREREREWKNGTLSQVVLASVFHFHFIFFHGGVLLNLQIRNVKCFLALHTWGRARNAAQKPAEKKPKRQKKKHVRHVNIFMVIPHNLRNALGSTEIFKMDCICIREGVEKSRGRAEGDVVGKRILHAAYEIDMQMLYEARGFFSPKGWLEVLTFAPRSLPLSLFSPSLSLAAMMMHVLFACKHDKNSN